MKRIIIFAIAVLFCFPALSQLVNIKSIRLNKCIPYTIDKDELDSSNLKIDSIVGIPEIMDALYSDSLIFIGESYFEYYKRNKKCVLSSIVFDNKIKILNINEDSLSAKTSFEDLKKIFPEDCKETHPISIYKKVNKYQTCSVGVKEEYGKQWDMRIRFFFLNNKLKIIHFWIPT